MSMSGIQFREAWLSNALQLIDQQAKTIEELQKSVAELQKQLADKQNSN